MLCYTPALGYLALKKRDFDRFYQHLVTPDGSEPRVDIICLGEEELSEWHHLFIGRQTLRGEVDEKLAGEADKKAAAIITALKTDPGEEPRVKFIPF